MANRTPEQYRRAELGKIHIAKKALGLDDDCYRDVLWTVCRVRSAADLDSTGRFKLIKHFESLGWSQGRKKAPKSSGKMTPEQMGKIEALLADASRPWQYAHSMATRMFKKDRLEWITVSEARKLIAALEYDAQKRHLRSSIERQMQPLGKDKQSIQKDLNLPKGWWNKIGCLKLASLYLYKLEGADESV
jgi:phage gp16-like protein